MTTDSTALTDDVVRLATGEARPVGRRDAAGAYSCPWCGTTVSPRSWHDPQIWAANKCSNPACLAHPATPAETVHQWQAEAAARRQKEADRKRRHERELAYLAEQNAEREALWASLAQQARENGQCFICLLGSGWQWGRPKFIRHRIPDYHNRAA